jgi:hypothetical protein
MTQLANGSSNWNETLGVGYDVEKVYILARRLICASPRTLISKAFQLAYDCQFV